MRMFPLRAVAPVVHPRSTRQIRTIPAQYQIPLFVVVLVLIATTTFALRAMHLDTAFGKMRMFPARAVAPVAHEAETNFIPRRTRRIRAIPAQYQIPLSVMALVLIAITTFALRAVHLDTAFDIHVDEVFYLRVSRNLITGHGLTYDGRPFYLHPPVYFFLEGAFIRFVQPSHAQYVQTFDIHQIYLARYVNVFFASLSATALFLIARRVAGWVAGFGAATLFALDPFVIRLNSWTLLETTAIAWVIFGYCALITGNMEGRLAWWRLIVAGSAFGLALLTKETSAGITLLPLVVLFATGWSLRRWQTALIGTIMLTFYGVYLLVYALTGKWEVFAEQKFSGLLRFTGRVKTTGFTKGGPSFSAAILDNLSQLATTYALLGLGVLAIVFLFPIAGAAIRLIIVWSACSYGLILYGIAFGTLEEQFFYQVICTAILSTAVAGTMYFRRAVPPLVTSLTVARRSALSALRARLYTIPLQVRPRTARARRIATGLLAFVTAVYITWCGYTWGVIHLTQDNGYEHIVQYFEGNVPPSSRVAATAEPGVFLLNVYVSAEWGSVEEFRQNYVQYVVASKRQVGTGYGKLRPDTYQWVQANGALVYVFSGKKYGQLEVYKLSNTAVPAPNVDAGPNTARPPLHFP